MTTAPDLSSLHGRVVLVKSSRDERNPPAGRRGWVEVKANSSGELLVAIVLDLPEMFTRRAHNRSFPLDHTTLERLLAVDPDTTFEFTVDEDLG